MVARPIRAAGQGSFRYPGFQSLDDETFTAQGGVAPGTDTGGGGGYDGGWEVPPPPPPDGGTDDEGAAPSNPSFAEMTPEQQVEAISRSALASRIAPYAKIASAVLTTVPGIGLVPTVTEELAEQTRRDFNNHYGTGYEDIDTLSSNFNRLERAATRAGIDNRTRAALEAAAGGDARDYGSRFSGGFDYESASRNQGRGGFAPDDPTAGDRSRTGRQQSALDKIRTATMSPNEGDSGYGPTSGSIGSYSGMVNTVGFSDIEVPSYSWDGVFGGSSPQQNDSDRGGGVSESRENAQEARGV